MIVPKKEEKKEKKTNSSSNIDPTLFANSCTHSFDWVRFATRGKKKDKRNQTGGGGGERGGREHGVFLQVTERGNFSFRREIQLEKNGTRAICHREDSSYGVKIAR